MTLTQREFPQLLRCDVKVSDTQSRNCNADTPSILKSACCEMTSDSALL